MSANPWVSLSSLTPLAISPSELLVPRIPGSCQYVPLKTWSFSLFTLLSHFPLHYLLYSFKDLLLALVSVTWASALFILHAYHFYSICLIFLSWFQGGIKDNVWAYSHVCALGQTLTSSVVPENGKERLQPGLGRAFWAIALLDEPASFQPISNIKCTLPWLCLVLQAILTTEKGETYLLPSYAYFQCWYYFHTTQKDMMQPSGPKIIQLSGFSTCLEVWVIKL